MQNSTLYTKVKDHESNEPHFMKDGLTEFTVICITAGGWKEANCLTAICWNQSQEAEITIKMGDHKRLEHQTLRVRNFNTQLYYTHLMKNQPVYYATLNFEHHNLKNYTPKMHV